MLASEYLSDLTSLFLKQLMYEVFVQMLIVKTRWMWKFPACQVLEENKAEAGAMA